MRRTPSWKLRIWQIIVCSSAWILNLDWHEMLVLETLLTEVRKYREAKQGAQK
ncbi:MAG TPA: hypothetical protein VEP90_10335 [Methylomirabilota bacterium]|nr:hypothetical protein [Methylomirabilota bacterium]